jgi:hypothetical protein
MGLEIEEWGSVHRSNVAAEALDVVGAEEVEPVVTIKHRNCFCVDLTTRTDELRMHIFDRARFPKRGVEEKTGLWLYCWQKAMA